MDRKEPLVSVIMPVYKAQAFVEEAIRSVIGQTLKDWELIIIDDCSPDGSYDLAKALADTDARICLLRNEHNLGVAKTRNRGIELSRGRYIAFLDSDDAWFPEKLERQLERMEAAGAGVGYCSYTIVGPAGDKAKPDYIVPQSTDFQRLMKENVILCSAMIVPAEIAKRIRFNTEFYHEDFVMALDILKEGHTAAGCPEPLLAWRYMADTRSFDKRKAAANRWRIYRDYLKLPLGKSLYVFAHYAAAGARKYFRKRRESQ